VPNLIPNKKVKLMEKIQFIYSFIPTPTSVEDSNSEGRWFSERLYNHVQSLFNYYPHIFISYHTSDYTLYLKKEITEEMMEYFKSKSPNITINYMGPIDVGLHNVEVQIREAINTALEYNELTIVNKLMGILIEILERKNKKEPK
jgi:hypothetical protein